MPIRGSISIFCLLIASIAADAQDNPTRGAMLYPLATHSSFPSPRETFDQARDLILREYYTESIDEPSLYHAAIEGMLSLISPPRDERLAKLWSPDEYEEFHNALRGVRVSVGIRSTFNQEDGSLTVTEVLAGSPAEGRLRRLDRIVRIDGQPLKQKSLEEVNALLSGEVGTTVRLTLVRDIEVLTLDLERREFKVDNVLVTRLPENVIHVRLKKITEDVSKELRALLAPMIAEGAHKAIIDLRENSGGVFAEGMRLAELFLPRNSVIVRTVRRKEGLKTYVSSNAAPFELELVVLTDETTASASEIFAAALKAHASARLVGMPTFGKATIEETFTLANGYRVKFIVGALYEPRGKSWEGRGIQPDVQVAMDPDLREKLAYATSDERLEKDPQLLAAWTLLQ